MTRQTWTAIFAAVVLVMSVGITALVPVPFVARGPGASVDLNGRTGSTPVTVKGTRTYPTQGALLLVNTSVTPVDSTVSLLEALHSYWSQDREVLPREREYPPGKTPAEIKAERKKSLEASQNDAVSAALQLAQLRVDRVPVVLKVSSTGPAVGKLQPDDIVLAVDEHPVLTEKDVEQAVASRRKVGDLVKFSVSRSGQVVEVLVLTVASHEEPDVPSVGVRFGLGYSSAISAKFALPESVSGKDAGLMFALSVYDQVTPEWSIGDRTVSGAGAIDGAGAISQVVGINELIATAENHGASVFLLPVNNCSDITSTSPAIRLVPVKNLKEAISALDSLADPQLSASVKGCS